jgi:hypothetical protein
MRIAKFVVCGRCGCNQPGIRILKCSMCNAVYCSVCGPCGKHSSHYEVLLGAVPLEGSSSLTQVVYGLVIEGRKLEAVRLYAQTTGCGLKEAKDFVDSL